MYVDLGVVTVLKRKSEVCMKSFEFLFFFLDYINKHKNDWYEKKEKIKSLKEKIF